ncbi:DNA/RNA polymerases superfamily protein [Gossypium australe]|uniref:DNA/RNA polymerases superfamily protein n=1 Tax=Gossypium australe TaxID=47621 RepID=A0A5B6W8F7_9ROSI|nr:DNA/RNA polymerases superfamily protein [Gossypium australe]
MEIDSKGTLRLHSRLCVPNQEDLKQSILFEAHHGSFAIHPGNNKMYQDLKPFYWWKRMKRYIVEYVSKCLTCQLMKAEHQVPLGLLQPITIPERKWERITMDFVIKLPLSSKKKDAIWLTKFTNFLPVRTDYSMEKYARLYIDEIVRLHEVPEKLHETLGTMLNFSTVFHPQTDGQSERVIQILEDMLRSCIIKFEGSWEKYLPLVEFAYKNSYQSSIQMAPYEALYGRKCRIPVCWTELNENKLLGLDLIKETKEKKSYANLKRKDIQYNVGEKVFLKVSPWKKVLRFGKKGKLSLRFIGLYEFLERVGPVTYRLALPPELEKIHNVFHVSMLQRYRFDSSHMITLEVIDIQLNLTYEEEPIKILAREVKELRIKRVPLVKVLWRHHNTEEATWETEETMRQ